MKSKLLLLAILATFFVSCQKASIDEGGSTPVGKLYPVGFNVWEFRDTASVVTNSVSTKSINALKDQIDYLQYYVFKKETSGNYVLVKQQIQKSTDVNFGTITDSLPANHYYVYFVGCQAPGHMEMKTKATGVALPIFYYNDNVIYDTFYAAAEIDLNGTLTKTILLSRVVAKVQVKLDDILPQEATAFRMSFTDYPLGLDMTTGIGELRAQSETALRSTKIFQLLLSSADKVSSGLTYSALVWAYDYPSITIGCINAKSVVLASKVLPKNRFGLYIRLENNMQYNYSGALFGTQSFGISTNAWSPEINARANIK
ncbi:FimB/Mfa2 family fimbrial subunit [Mucilaginibacter agri]|uniref:Fimbrillin-A associated anchor protein Mfa1 and Mfa2 n=1 Tax=Mucilaginibacter agri TaxID=2695265 RepID=A0A965ZMM7_9SPHI|nr:FimB/Mfa2 family fimbrial subunit [Mucilaginibacter agri]NCD72381.1 hypothetical protein [Mucilaginibacter agri]